MTHDELLARIGVKSAHPFSTIKYNEEGQKDIQDLVKALRAVVELHKPIKGFFNAPDRCEGCEDRCSCYEGDLYDKNTWKSCPTIQAIEKELS